MLINKTYFLLSHITIHPHVSIASATIIRVSYKNTNNNHKHFVTFVELVKNLKLRDTYKRHQILFP